MLRGVLSLSAQSLRQEGNCTKPSCVQFQANSGGDFGESALHNVNTKLEEVKLSKE
jgi:hypothetical protein